MNNRKRVHIRGHYRYIKYRGGRIRSRVKPRVNYRKRNQFAGRLISGQNPYASLDNRILRSIGLAKSLVDVSKYHPSPSKYNPISPSIYDHYPNTSLISAMYRPTKFPSYVPHGPSGFSDEELYYMTGLTNRPKINTSALVDYNKSKGDGSGLNRYYRSGGSFLTDFISNVPLVGPLLSGITGQFGFGLRGRRIRYNRFRLVNRFRKRY